MPLIQFTERGLYCAQGDFFIDPWRPVDYAVITHAHSDHARWGSKNYLCHHATKPLLQLRLGTNNYQSVAWGEVVTRHGVQISLHPAGHIIGSSQVRVAYKGEVWVFTGDFKIENDGISGAFEPVSCHSFITESTFGLPIYKWKPQALLYNDIQQWVMNNKAEGQVSVLIGYSLGKAQRILKAVAEVATNIYVHGAIWNTQQALLSAGHQFPEVKRVTPDIDKSAFRDAVIIAPPSSDGTPWMNRFKPYRVGMCSGWMQVRGNRRRRNADAGFALSDHADWNGLLQAVEATGAETIYATHGFQAAFTRFLKEQGKDAHEVKTQYGAEEDEQEPNEVAANQKPNNEIS